MRDQLHKLHFLENDTIARKIAQFIDSNACTCTSNLISCTDIN